MAAKITETKRDPSKIINPFVEIEFTGLEPLTTYFLYAMASNQMGIS